MSTLDSLPIAVVFVAIVALCLIASEVGFFIGRRIQREHGLDKYPIENSASGIVLGLLAFILAFSFGAVAGRYTELREIGRDDTDAISDVYLMTDFLPEESAPRARSLLYEYHKVRLDGIAAKDLNKLTKAIDHAEEIQNELWEIVVDARRKNESSILNQVVSMLHTLMDTHNHRVNKGLNTRLPGAIWWTTGGLLALSSMLLGLSSGLHGRRSRIATAIVVFCFSAVIIMIVDLDRPFRTLFSRSVETGAEKLLEQMEADSARQLPSE